MGRRKQQKYTRRKKKTKKTILQKIVVGILEELNLVCIFVERLMVTCMDRDDGGVSSDSSILWLVES